VTSVYLSFRREDDEHIVRQLAQRLDGHFEVMVDVPADEPGITAAQADAVVAVIGPRWIEMTHQGPLGNGDRVSAEIVAALQHGVPVIPVLLEGARMPSHAELPDALSRLASRQAVAVRADSFTSDVAQLIAAVERRVPAPQRQQLSADNGEARRQRRISELQDQITAAAEAGDWQIVLNLGSELTSLHPENDDPGGLVTTARQRLAEARRRRLSSHPEQGIEGEAVRPLQEPGDDGHPAPAAGTTSGEKPPQTRKRPSLVPLLLLVVAIFVVLLVLLTM
jgi:hypothetical protein